MSSFHDRIETKWQERWERDGAFRTPDLPEGPRYYCLEMLPYPSGRIHMGHVRNYSIGDVVARFSRRRGFTVMHPIGWDALGLPAENAALQRGANPADWTSHNIAHMRRQLRRLGFSYDWKREFATCDPAYYRWNQWFFLKMWERGLAYRRNGTVNWCPGCETVLANEQVEAGRCWRCEAVVEQRELPQWFLRITEYADELLDATDRMPGWPSKVLVLQRNWIGRSEGAEVRFAIPALEEEGDVPVFTTRVDTIYGATALVLAPGHPAARAIAARNPAVADYIRAALEGRAGETHPTGSEVEKTGVETGFCAVNPFSGDEIPVFVADYVLMEYGTGAVMAVPAHDERDHEFAAKYGLPIRTVVIPNDPQVADSDRAFTDCGTVVDSGPFSGLPSEEAKTAMAEHARERGYGGPKVAWRFRDWGISRQRYWGTPIPMIHCRGCGEVPVPEADLPVELPREIEITGKGGAALSKMESWLLVDCPRCGAGARRETDTMDTFVDSSWYFYRYLDPRNDKAPFDAEKARAWFPIDLYIGGVEHAILHLIYCRFWTRMMRDLGLVDGDEPVLRQLSQGMVIKDGAKMSKSKGNIVDPDPVVQRHGADTIRLHVLFESPPEKEMDWTDARLAGPARYLRRLERMIPGEAEWLVSTPLPTGEEDFAPADLALRRKTHQTIRRVTRDLQERIHPNTAIAAIMELTTALSRRLPEAAAEGARRAAREAVEAVVSLLNPMAPHITEELWERLGGGQTLVNSPWPECDGELARDEQALVVLQVNGETPWTARSPRRAARRCARRAGPGERRGPPSSRRPRGAAGGDGSGPARELRGRMKCRADPSPAARRCGGSSSAWRFFRSWAPAATGSPASGRAFPITSKSWRSCPSRTRAPFPRSRRA